MSAMLNIKKPPIEKKTSVHKLKCLTEESFKAAFIKDAIELHEALDTIAPLKEIQVAVHQRQPWFKDFVKVRHKLA